MLPVYVINLVSSQARWQRAKAQLDDIDIPHQRFDAVDGTQLSLNQLSRHYDRAKGMRLAYDLSLPEIGCYLSHMNVWATVAQNDCSGAFVMEDDFKALPNLAEVMEVLSAQEFVKPTVIQLSYSGPLGPILRSEPLNHTIML